MRRESLLDRLLARLIGLVVVVVGVVLALRWVYEQLLDMVWLWPLLAVLVAAATVWRFTGRRL